MDPLDKICRHFIFIVKSYFRITIAELSDTFNHAETIGSGRLLYLLFSSTMIIKYLLHYVYTHYDMILIDSTIHVFLEKEIELHSTE